MVFLKALLPFFLLHAQLYHAFIFLVFMILITSLFADGSIGFGGAAGR